MFVNPSLRSNFSVPSCRDKKGRCEVNIQICHSSIYTLSSSLVSSLSCWKKKKKGNKQNMRGRSPDLFSLSSSILSSPLLSLFFGSVLAGKKDECPRAQDHPATFVLALSSPFFSALCFSYGGENCKQSRVVGFGAARVRVGVSPTNPSKERNKNRKQESAKIEQGKKAGSCSLQRGSRLPLVQA